MINTKTRSCFVTFTLLCFHRWNCPSSACIITNNSGGRFTISILSSFFFNSLAQCFQYSSLVSCRDPSSITSWTSSVDVKRTRTVWVRSWLGWLDRSYTGVSFWRPGFMSPLWLRIKSSCFLNNCTYFNTKYFLPLYLLLLTWLQALHAQNWHRRGWQADQGHLPSCEILQVGSKNAFSVILFITYCFVELVGPKKEKYKTRLSFYSEITLSGYLSYIFITVCYWLLQMRNNQWPERVRLIS